MTDREAVLEGELVRAVRLGFGGLAFKIAPTTIGLPDRLVVLPGGRQYLVELKAEGGAVSAAQRSLHGRLAALGVEVHVVTGREGIRDWIRARGEELTPSSPYVRPRVRCQVCRGVFVGREYGTDGAAFPAPHGPVKERCRGSSAEGVRL